MILVSRSLRFFFKALVLMGLAPLLMLSSSTTLAATSSWTNTASGLWRVGNNWSDGQVPVQSSVLITNGNSKTVTLDSATPAESRVIQKLTVSAPNGATNSLLLQDLSSGDPLQLSGTLTLDRGGAMEVRTSGVTIDGTSGAILNIPAGELILESGVIDGSSTTAAKVGSVSGRTGAVAIKGGALQLFQIQLGAGNGATGSLELSAGSFQATSLITLGQVLNSSGVVSISGGKLTATNDLTRIGNLGNGQLSLSGGSAQFAFLSLGENLGASGSVTLSGGQLLLTPRDANDLLRVGSMGAGYLSISGGTHLIQSEFHLADDLGATGIVSVTGGELIVTNAITAIGRYGFGQLTVSNASVQLTNASVGRHDGAVGRLLVQRNGMVKQIDDLSIGRFANSSGYVEVDGGFLSLTNDNVWVGREGAGRINVLDGLLSAQNLFVGMSPDGSNAPTGTLTIAGGISVVSSNLIVGTELVSSGQVQVTGGKLVVSGAGGKSYTRLANGTIVLSGGTFTTDELFLTNATGKFTFNGGLLQATAVHVSNGSPFVVGDGTSPATFEMLGGTYAFADGLVISSNAKLTGCGTIIGSIVNNGTIATNCGSVVVAPSISDQPLNQSVVQGQTATFSVVASGTAPLVYEWHFNGTPIPGANASTYTKLGAQPEDSGSYSVLVSNSAGSVTSDPAVLTVLVPPTIVSAPQNISVAPGSSATFTVSASGTAPLYYQWRFGGIEIPGATDSTFTRSNVTVADEGSYSVIVSNIAGTVSSSASLSIAAGFTITLQEHVAFTNVISLTSAAGLVYTLEFKDTLSDSAWTSIAPSAPGNGGILYLQDTNANSPTRFYRVRAQ